MKGQRNGTLEGTQQLTCQDLDALALSTGSFDLHALRGILDSGYSPKLVLLEVQGSAIFPFFRGQCFSWVEALVLWGFCGFFLRGFAAQGRVCAGS